MSEEDDYKTAQLRYASSHPLPHQMDHKYLNTNEFEEEEDLDDDDDDFDYVRSSTANYDEPRGEWIESQEIVSGRHFFYNSISMEIVFDRDPRDKDMRQRGRGTNQNGDNEHQIDIASNDITDDEIPSYLLKFDQAKWDFNNEAVSIYRLQSASIDHTKMLPHPISIQFPEFFSTNTIPKKEQFLAEILPPKDNTLFPTTSKQWKVRVIVDQTTAKQLIDKIVDGKLKISLNTEAYDGDAETIIDRAPEFILKVVGCEEYILYDDTKLIVDYEAVRKAVRNEDDVIFQLDHRPDLSMIEKECFERSIWHIMQFKNKYENANLLTDKIKEKYSYYNKYVKYGCGEGMSLSEIITAKNNNGFTKAYQVEQDRGMKKIQNNNNNKNESDDIPPPPPLPPPQHSPESSATHTIIVEDVAADHSDNNIKEAQIQSNTLKVFNQDKAENYTRQRSGSNKTQHVANVDIMHQFKTSMKNLSGKEILNHIPSLRDTQYLESQILPAKEQIRQRKELKEMLLHEFAQFYRIKMSFMTNVTQLPRYKHYLQSIYKMNEGQKLQPKQKQLMNKKLSVFVRHELWIGDLKYDSTTFDTDHTTKISDGMRFKTCNEYKTSKTQKWCNLARESCISFTVFLCSLEKEEIPLAFARFPVIDICNRLRFGKYALNLWPIPVYVAEYKGLKSDPYKNLAFRYRGTTTDRHFKVLKKESKIDKLTGRINGASADKLNIWKLGIEFERRKFCIIAPPLNHRHDYKSQKLKREAQRLSRQATENFSIHNISKDIMNDLQLNNNENEQEKEHLQQQKRGSFMKMFKKKDDLKRKKDEAEDIRKAKEWQRVHAIVSRDILYDISFSERKLIWKYRDELCIMPSALNIFLRCVDWRLPLQRSEAYDYLEKWSTSPHLEDSLELLSYEFQDSFVREFGVQRIAAMHDSDLQRYLLQLCQCLKYELHHNNALIRLLQRRALCAPYQIGHFLFWHLFSEYRSAESHEFNLQFCERFGLYLEEYLLFSSIGITRDILIQCNLCTSLSTINSKLRLKKKELATKEERNKYLQQELLALNQLLPNTFILPINPRWRCTYFIVDECRTMDSAQMPLWLSCKNIDDSTGDQNTIIMFKTGDDLRQDILTLQVLRCCDKIWLDRGLNLRLLPYNVVSSGDGQGMVQIVLNARTTTYIHTKYGGGAQKGARDSSTHLKYLQHVNNNQIMAVASARDIYTRSCAGYCIASYVLGLGDRHPSNIMVRKKGELFHIDFSHFLGNFKSQNIIGDVVKWQREVAPFVFLPAYKYCINNANHDEEQYNKFVTFAVNAYLALRQRHRLLINLFVLMLPSMMPELIQKEDIYYLRDQLHLENIKNENVYQHILKIIKVCLNDKRRIIDNTFHAMKHQ